MTDVARLADRIIVIDSGRMIMEGTPKEVFGQSDILKQAGLDLPPVTEFTEELRSRGFDISETILDADAAVEEIAASLVG